MHNTTIRSFHTKLWNNLERSIKNEPDIKIFKNVLKTKLKPKKHRHYNFGKKHPNTLLCRLRVGRSFLNSHSFSIGHSDTDLCLCGLQETVTHFFTCFIYTNKI